MAPAIPNPSHIILFVSKFRATPTCQFKWQLDNRVTQLLVFCPLLPHETIDTHHQEYHYAHRKPPQATVVVSQPCTVSHS